MPKHLPPDLLDRVVAVLGEHPEGLTIAALEKRFKGVASRRSLQRKLVQWARRNNIRVDGVRRGLRYLAAATQPKPMLITPGTGAVNVLAQAPAVQVGIPISAQGEAIQAFVRRPLVDRPPVTYQRGFLDRYIPNATSYLPETLRNHLHELGRTPDEQRPAGTYARDLLNRLLIDLSWASSRLEGNTYSLLDTQELIERGTAAPGKDAKETQMILNHKAAIELLVDSAEEIGVNRHTITNLHALLSDNLLHEPRNAGRLRETPIAIGGSTYLPTAIPQLIEELFTRLLQLGAAIQDPFEQSFFLLVHLPYLQPFVDVNKRTSRLASNIPLIKRNLVPLSFIDVPEQTYIEGLTGIYELNGMELLRDVYLWAYERSARQYKNIGDSLPEPDPFRLRYRTVLSEVVGGAVRKLTPPTPDVIEALAAELVPLEDVSRFTQLVLDELRGLHEGNIARFRLRPSEFRRWQTA